MVSDTREQTKKDLNDLNSYINTTKHKLSDLTARIEKVLDQQEMLKAKKLGKTISKSTRSKFSSTPRSIIVDGTRLQKSPTKK
eukprot:Pgem_evm1s12754